MVNINNYNNKEITNLTNKIQYKYYINNKKNNSVLSKQP